MIPLPLIEAPRVMANQTLTTLATPHFANVSAYFINGTNETSGPPDYGAWFQNSLWLYSDFLGPMAYLLIFFIPFGMIWMANGDTRLLCVLGLITGPFVLLMLPGPWAAAAVIVMVVSIVALYWRLARP